MVLDENPLISIVVPVYNVEKYLKTCVDSIIKQTYKNIEIILVNDGSSDSSGKLCDEIKQNDKRIKVLHKSNGGLSDARNTGVSISNGYYTMFIDSDDFLKNEYVLERLVKKAQIHDVDFILFRFEKFYEDDNIILPEKEYPTIDSFNCSNVLYELARKGTFPISACTKLVKTDIIRKVPFKKGYLSEDIDWFIKIAILSSTCICTNEICYVYRQRKGSISYNTGLKNILDILDQIHENLFYIQNAEINSKLKKALLAGLAYEYTIVLGLLSLIDITKVNKNQYEVAVNKINNLKYILQNDLNIKVKIIKILIFFIGKKMTIKLLGYRITKLKGKK